MITMDAKIIKDVNVELEKIVNSDCVYEVKKNDLSNLRGFVTYSCSFNLISIGCYIELHDAITDEINNLMMKRFGAK